MACGLAYLALWPVSFNWSAIDLMRCTGSPQCSPQIGRLVSAGQPCDCWASAAGRKERWGRRACVFSSCYVHVSPDFFLLGFSISFLVLYVVPCCPILLVPTMHDGDKPLILCSFSLTGFALHTVCQ